MKKLAGFHWDPFLLKLIIGVARLLGLPFTNGLIPQPVPHASSPCGRRISHYRPRRRRQPRNEECERQEGPHVNLASPMAIVEHCVSSLA